MSSDNEEELSVMDAFQVAWGKFTKFIDKASAEILPPSTAAIVQQGIRQPYELALYVISDKLKRREPNDPEWEKVENRRKQITSRDTEAAILLAKEALSLPTLEVPEATMNKFFDYCDVFLELVDELNETSQ